MKIIHCADLHLDSKMETNFSPEQAKGRRYEILATFERMVSYASDHQVEVIIISGDMFDTPQSQQKTIKNRVMDTISENDQIDFIYLQGNHDRDYYFKKLDPRPSNLKLFTTNWSAYRYGNVVIAGREFSNNQSGDFYQELLLDENDFNIVMLHGQIVSYQADNKAETINLEQLKNKDIDYLALGHIHEARCDKLDYRGVWCYPGCLEGRGFDECGTKGFYLLDIQGNSSTREFVSLAKRTFHEVTVDISKALDAREIAKLVERQLEGILAEDIVKVIITGTVDEETELDWDYLEHKIANRFYFAKLADLTEVKIDYTKYAQDISFKGEFIRTVAALDLNDEDKNRIIMMGINAIMGKEVG